MRGRMRGVVAGHPVASGGGLTVPDAPTVAFVNTTQSQFTSTWWTTGHVNGPYQQAWPVYTHHYSITPGSNGGSAVTEYKTYYDLNAVSAGTSTTFSVYTHTNANQPYNIVVRAVNAVGTSAASNTLNGLAPFDYCERAKTDGGSNWNIDLSPITHRRYSVPVYYTVYLEDGTTIVAGPTQIYEPVSGAWSGYTYSVPKSNDTVYRAKLSNATGPFSYSNNIQNIQTFEAFNLTTASAPTLSSSGAYSGTTTTTTVGPSYPYYVYSHPHAHRLNNFTIAPPSHFGALVGQYYIYINGAYYASAPTASPNFTLLDNVGATCTVRFVSTAGNGAVSNGVVLT